MVFEKKKIGLETLGEYLLQTREKLGLTAAEVADRMGIQPKFIEKLEQGRFDCLPADVYVIGFLKQMAQIYGTQAEVLIEQYKKERKIQVQLENFTYHPVSAAKKYLNKIIVTPKILSLFLGGLFVVGTLVYIIWQVFSINKTPSLEISQPKDRQIIYGLTAEVEGHTDPGMIISIDNKNIYVDSKGNFNTEIGITDGPQDLIILAQNRFGKNVSKTVSVVGEDKQGTVAASSSSVTLKLVFLYDTSISFVVDSTQPKTATFTKGTSTTIDASSQISLSTSDAGAIQANLNGQDLGILGKRQEKLNNVTFSPGFGTIK